MEKPEITLDTVVVQDEEPIATTVDGEVVMLSARAESYFGLGEVGSVVWDMVGQPCSVRDICAKLEEEFDVDTMTCQSDVTRFIGDMLGLGLVKPVPAGAPR